MTSAKYVIADPDAVGDRSTTPFGNYFVGISFSNPTVRISIGSPFWTSAFICEYVVSTSLVRATVFCCRFRSQVHMAHELAGGCNKWSGSASAAS